MTEHVDRTPEEESADKVAEEAYLNVIQKASKAKRPAPTVRECRDAVVAALLKAEADDRITLDLELAARAVAERCDSRVTDFGKKTLRRAARGELPLDGVLDEVVLPVAGARPLLGDFDFDLWFAADQERYRNVTDANAAYEDWRKLMTPFIPLLKEGRTVREVIRKGLL